MDPISICLSAATALSPILQDAPAGASKPWTQAELESVSNEIKADIEAMRGMKFTRPVKVQLADRSTFFKYMRKREEVSEPPERQARDETIIKMLGLIAPDADLSALRDELLGQQVGGFYDPGSDAFYLIESFGGDLARVILAHELTHALDDQHFDFDDHITKLGMSSDAEWAYWAVIEGSGSSAMNQWM